MRKANIILWAFNLILLTVICIATLYTNTEIWPSTFGPPITGMLEVMHSEMTVLLIATLGVFVVGLVIGLYTARSFRR